MRWSEEEYQAYLQRRNSEAPKEKTAKPRKNKYGAKKTWVDGICFDSVKEAEYYGSLKLLLRTGTIDGYLYHGKMVCTEGTDKENRATLYEPDFIVLFPDGTYKIVDTKSEATITQAFKLKMKCLREKFPKIQISIE